MNQLQEMCDPNLGQYNLSMDWDHATFVLRAVSQRASRQGTEVWEAARALTRHLKNEVKDIFYSLAVNC